MKYNDFTNQVYARVKEGLKDSGEDVRVELGDAKVVNRSGVTLSVIKGSVGSVFYLSDMEAHGESVDSAVEFVLQSCFPTGETAESIQQIKESLFDIDFVKEHVIPVLVNTKKNQKSLESMVSREIFDLSLIYKIAVSQGNEDTRYSVAVTKALASTLNLSEKDLWESAWTNVELSDAPICEVLRKMGVENPEFEMTTMRVLSVEGGCSGAIAMLVDSVLQNVSSEYGTDLFIIPSSIHEVLAIPCGNQNAEVSEIRRMIHDVNDSVVSPEDILSYSAYWYDRFEHTLHCKGYEPIDLRNL